MFDSILSSNSGDNKSDFFSNLNQQDRFALLIFYIGVLISLKATDIAEQSISLGQKQELSAKDESDFLYEFSKLFALANWLYFSATILLLDTASLRLEEEQTSESQNGSPLNKERIRGRELVVTGNTFKAIGFILSATGNEIIADSTNTPLD